jgi:hypothetical protein
MTHSRAPLIVAIVLLLLPVLYVGATWLWPNNRCLANRVIDFHQNRSVCSSGR